METIANSMKRLEQFLKEKQTQVAKTLHYKVVTCPKHGEINVTVKNGEPAPHKCPICAMEEEEKDAEKQYKLDELKRIGNGAVRKFNDFLGAFNTPLNSLQTFENYTITAPQELEIGQKQALEICKRFALRFSDRLTSGNPKKSKTGLLLMGKYGTGKTHLANAICREVAKQGLMPVMMTARTLFNFYNPNCKLDINALTLRLAKVPLLVIDELGRTSGSAYECNQLIELLDARTRNGLPSVLITNLTASGLNETLGGALMSRLQPSFYPLIFDWDDYRESQSLLDENPLDLFF